jgi:hypothetical protein
MTHTTAIWEHYERSSDWRLWGRDWLRVAEVASELGVNEQRVYQLVRAGRLSVSQDARPLLERGPTTGRLPLRATTPRVVALQPVARLVLLALLGRMIAMPTAFAGGQGLRTSSTTRTLTLY